jgi:hypothetical protein
VLSRHWALAPGAVAAGRDITGPITMVVNRGPDDPLGAALPSAPLMATLYQRLDLGRFVGREELVRQITAATTGSGSGYVVIRAEAGVGKTALAARLVWDPVFPCAYHFTLDLGPPRVLWRLNLPRTYCHAASGCRQ